MNLEYFSKNHVSGGKINHFKRYAVLLAFLPVLAGCSLALEDGQPDSGPVKFEDAGESCLDNSLPAVSKFFGGEGSAKEIDAAWTCLSSALKTFETHVRGGEQDRYSARELKAFLERFFLTQQKLSDSLVLETMRIKQMLLGGDLNYLTRQELKQIYVILDTFRVECAKLAPYMKILNLDYPVPTSDEQRAYVERGLHQMVSSGITLGKLLGRSQNAYHLTDAATFLREFGKLYSKDKEWDGPEKFIRQLPLVVVMKSFFLRPTGNSIAPDEWKELVAKAARLFSLYMRSHYLFPKGSLVSGEGLRQISTFVSDLFVILDESVAAKPNKVIEYRQLFDLIDHLYSMEVMKLPVDVETAKRLVVTAFGKVFNPSVKGHRKNSDGITDSSITWMRKDFFGWTEIQQAWDNMNAGDAVTMGELRSRWAKLKLGNQDAATEISLLLGRPHPLVITEKGTVDFDPNSNSVRVTRKSWNELNWRRTVIRLLIRGFTDDAPNEAYTGLKKANYDAAFEELRPLMEALDLIDPGDQSLKASLLDESNLFMPSADGNTTISFHEGMEIMSFILSGTKISAPISAKVTDKCTKQGKHPKNGAQMYDHQCYSQLLEENLESYFSAMPNWVAMLKNIRGENWPDFSENILIATKDKHPDLPADNFHITTGQITKTAVIMQYIEALFMRFELDRSGTLNLTEAMVAYPLLYPTIREETKNEDGEYMSDADVEAIYTYFLRYGERPDKNLGTKIRYLLWKNTKSKWKFEADRIQVLKVIAQLRGG